jgi:hypothetical protein
MPVLSWRDFGFADGHWQRRKPEKPSFFRESPGGMGFGAASNAG